MISTNDIRSKVIDQLMAIKDAEYLRALSEMIDRSNVEKEIVAVTEEQKVMLEMSDEDINKGRTIDHYTLNKQELEWLKRK